MPREDTEAARRGEGPLAERAALFGPRCSADPADSGGRWCSAPDSVSGAGAKPSLRRQVGSGCPPSGSGRGRCRWARFTVLAQRKPTLLLRLSGEFLLRLAARTFVGSLLFQEPPRSTREQCPKSAEPLPSVGNRRSTRAAGRLARALGACPATDHSADLQAVIGEVLALGGGEEL